jgi:chaperonin cofactor prefoldin
MSYNNKGPSVYQLYVERGTDPDDPSKTCPISRLPGGKRALFKREHWSMIKLGDTWEASVEIETDNYAMMQPMKRISSDSRVDLQAQDILVELAEEEIEKLRNRMDVLSDDLLPLENQQQHLSEELAELQKKMGPMESELAELKSKADTLDRAVRSMRGASP